MVTSAVAIGSTYTLVSELNLTSGGLLFYGKQPNYVPGSVDVSVRAHVTDVRAYNNQSPIPKAN